MLLASKLVRSGISHAVQTVLEKIALASSKHDQCSVHYSFCAWSA